MWSPSHTFGATSNTYGNQKYCTFIAHYFRQEYNDFSLTLYNLTVQQIKSRIG